jgi:putative NADPH-quinone reductase
LFALSIVAHPSANSFSHAMAVAAHRVLESQGYQLAVHDLYAEGFDPVQPTGESGNTVSAHELVELHCGQLARADLILVFHPNWWGQPPAILKGWIDRVFRLNTAYGYAEGTGYEGVPLGLLKARCALVFNTSNTPPQRELAVFGDPLQTLWGNCIFGLCGVSNFVRRMYGPISGSTPKSGLDGCRRLPRL